MLIYLIPPLPFVAEGDFFLLKRFQAWSLDRSFVGGWTRCMKLLVSLFFLLGLLSAEEVEESYVLAKEGWEPPVGLKVRISTVREMPTGKTKWTEDGSWTTGKVGRLEKNILEVIRETEDSYLFDYKEVADHHRSFYNGEKTNSKINGVFHEQEVKVEKEGGDWVARLVDEDSFVGDQDRLDKRLTYLSDNILYDYAPSLLGTEIRKVGDTWDVDKPKIPTMGNGDVMEGKATLTFDRLEEHQGHQCAVLSLTFKVKIDHTKNAGGLVEYAGKGTIIRSLEGLFDLEYEIKGMMKSTYRYDEGGTLETEGRSKISSKLTILPTKEEKE